MSVLVFTVDIVMDNSFDSTRILTSNRDSTRSQNQSDNKRTFKSFSTSGLYELSPMFVASLRKHCLLTVGLYNVLLVIKWI